MKLGRLLVTVKPSFGDQLRDNLRNVRPMDSTAELEALVRDAFASYGRYWADSFQLPRLSPEVIDQHFSVENYHLILEAQERGTGAIMVLPHLGGWEWAAAWLGRVANKPVTAAVERLEPDDLFEWFVELRESYGVNVVPLGSSALPQLVQAVKDGHVVCLLSDRDIGGTGIEVDFFGAPTTMPGGAALLARRTGAPILPTAVYFRDDRSHCVIRPGIEVDPNLKLRDYVETVTKEMAAAFEGLIDEDPGQWHVLQPVWPQAKAKP